METKLSECIEWTKATTKGGYPVANIGGKTTYMHRKTWEDANGKIPEGLVVRHKCDNRKCINLEHLEIGTVKDNSEDCVSRGRQAKGSRHPGTKLTEEQVVSIKEDTRRQVDIAAEYGIAQSYVSVLRSGKYVRSGF